MIIVSSRLLNCHVPLVCLESVNMVTKNEIEKQEGALFITVQLSHIIMSQIYFLFSAAWKIDCPDFSLGWHYFRDTSSETWAPFCLMLLWAQLPHVSSLGELSANCIVIHYNYNVMSLDLLICSSFMIGCCCMAVLLL